MFKVVRTTAIIFAVLLTIITYWLLNGVGDIKEAPDTFWLAIGVIIGAFATAISQTHRRQRLGLHVANSTHLLGVSRKPTLAHLHLLGEMGRAFLRQIRLREGWIRIGDFQISSMTT